MEDIDIWRAASQMIDLYPDEAESASLKRADSALAQGDLFNFQLWSKITKAVQALERKAEGQALH